MIPPAMSPALPPALPLDLAAQRFPEILAYWDTQHQVTYRQLLQDVEAQSNQLRSAGLRPGDRLAWLPQNDYASLRMFWAVVHAGGVACPLSHHFPDDSRRQLCQRLRAAWWERGQLSFPETWASSTSAETARTPSATLTAPATLILSSGSTGTPKAIVHSLAQHLANAHGAAANMPLRSGDRWLWSLPLYHVSGLSILIRCAAAAATVVGVASEETHRGKQRLSAEQLRLATATHLSLVPVQLQRLLAEPSFPADLLQAVLLGGSAVPAPLVREAISRGVPLHLTYGMTEMGSQITTTRPLQPGDGLSSGQVLPGREVRIDRQGEIQVRGDCLCLGYDMPITDEHGPGRDCRLSDVRDTDGWFSTGDLGHWDEAGNLHVVGRRDNMFISGGENVHPEAIERVLVNQPEIAQAVVLAVPDPEFGQHAVAVIQRTSDVSDGELSTRLAKELRRFELPRRFLDWPQDLQTTGIKLSRNVIAQAVGIAES